MECFYILQELIGPLSFDYRGFSILSLLDYNPRGRLTLEEFWASSSGLYTTPVEDD